MTKLVAGVGTNDANYRVNVKGVWCPYYRRWNRMLQRAYSSKPSCTSAAYYGVTVCEEWLTFSNFKAWMETQDWEDKHLDKDLLVPGNKVYSPETCVFVDSTVNGFILDCVSKRGDYPQGVTLRKDSGKFRARCCNPFTGKYEALGQYSSAGEAHKAWVSRKYELALALASTQTQEIKDALINRFKEFK